MLLTRNKLLILLYVTIITIVIVIILPVKKKSQTIYTVNWEKYNDVSEVSMYTPKFYKVKRVYRETKNKEEVKYVDPSIPEFIRDKGNVNYTNYASKKKGTIVSSNIETSLNFTQYEAPIESKLYNSKTYMKFQTLGKGDWNRQGHLCRQKECTTGDYNIRMIDGRYLVALGSFYSTKIGQYIDIVLEDGSILKCILGDQKADEHTDETHRYHKIDKSVVEFIIDSPGENRHDYSYFTNKYPYVNGNFSNIDDFKFPVKYIRVYDKVYDIDMGDLSNDNPDRR